MNRIVNQLALCLLATLLGACSNAPPDAQATSSVAVTTIKPERRVFHHSVYAWGEVAADSRALEHLSLAHGGLISELAVTSGQSVHKGDVLLRMATDPAALRGFRQARNALALARGDLARIKRLAAQKLATDSQLAAARKAVADAEAALAAERAQGTTQGSHALQAPADGVITTVHVGRGNRVAANAPLLDFSPAHALVARLGVQPDQSDQLAPGMPVHLKSVYGDRDAAYGTLDMVGHAVDTGSHLVPVRVTIPAAMASHLINGSPIEGNIQTSSFKAWAVPRDAVLKDQQGPYLFQLRNGKAARVAVKVEAPGGTTIGVSGPLQANLPVIVHGAYELSDGDAVRESTP